MRCLLPISLLALILASGPLFSQTLSDPARAVSGLPAAAPSSDLLADTVTDDPGLDNPGVEAPTSAADSDIGLQLILRNNEKKRHFRASVDTSAFWTDNAANVSAGEQEDWFAVGGVNVTWQQRVKGRFIADAQLGVHAFRYDQLQVLDYEYWDGNVGLIVQMPELWDTLLFAQYGYQRVTQDFDAAALYEAHSARLGLFRAFTINRLNSVFITVQSQLALAAEPETLERHEHSASLGYTLRLSRTLNLQASYRLVYYDYFNLEGRQDWYQNAGLALTYRPKEWLELGLSYNYTVNRSNYDAFSFNSQLAGPSLAARIRF